MSLCHYITRHAWGALEPQGREEPLKEGEQHQLGCCLLLIFPWSGCHPYSEILIERGWLDRRVTAAAVAPPPQKWCLEVKSLPLVLLSPVMALGHPSPLILCQKEESQNVLYPWGNGGATYSLKLLKHARGKIQTE